MSILDQSAPCVEDRLRLVYNRDGTCEIVAENEQAGRGGFAPAWGQPYRKVLNDILRSVQSSTKSWLEFHAAYLEDETLTKGPLGGREMIAVHFVAGAHTYTAYTGTHHKGSFLGFGGRRAEITMADGRVFESNNLWSGRDVPPDLRDILRDNAAIKWL
ncbi:MAG: hypothetical protein WCY32_14550 [Burkholderiaceae bacterium]